MGHRTCAPGEVDAAAQVALRTTSGRAGVYQVQTVNHASELVQNLAIRVVKKGELGRMDFPDRLGFGEPQQFQVSWNASGEVQAILNGGQPRTVQIGEPITSLELVASGGAAQFSALSVSCYHSAS